MKDYTHFIKANNSNFSAILTMLTYRQQFKINHWQTEAYAQHMAFDKIYDSLDDSIDTFVEVIQGKYGRFKVGAASIPLVDLSSLDPIAHATSFADYLVETLPTFVQPKDTELLNIRDEMLAQVNQLKYLLTLK